MANKTFRRLHKNGNCFVSLSLLNAWMLTNVIGVDDGSTIVFFSFISLNSLAEAKHVINA